MSTLPAGCPGTHVPGSRGGERRHHNGRVEDPGYPVAWEADVLLRDGHPVHLRPITPGDGAALRRFHAGLSARSVYLRFFSAKPELTDADVAYFTGVDHTARVALIALDRGRIIGVGRFDAVGDGSAEVAFLIADEVQGLGLGSVLLEHLAAAGRERGVERFVAEVLPENARMLATFREAGFELSQRREDDVIAVSFAIEPTAASRDVTAAREHRAEARSMARMLRPGSVAVVGASRAPGGLGHAVLGHLLDGGFTGRMVAVHPEVDQIAGVPCVRHLRDAGEPIDLAVVVVPAASVPAVLEDAAAARVHGIVVVSGGFGDTGPEGLALQAELVATAHAAGMRVVGPNALGVINTATDVRLNASLVPSMPARGRAGFFCQSGALGASILSRAAQRGVGVSTFVSAGNRADVSGNDLLQFWQEDQETEVVLLHLETIGNARKFARLVHGLSARKPVIMVRTGGAELRHPLGHQVARTSLSQAAVDQVLADCGLVVVESVDHMLDVARVVLGQPLPVSAGVAIVGNSDALASLAANALATAGLEVRSTTTFARRESVEAYTEAMRACAHQADVGAVLVIYVPPIEESVGDDIRSALQTCSGCGELRHVPVAAVMTGVSAPSTPEQVPVYADVETAARALADAWALARWRTDDERRHAADDDAWDPLDVTIEPGVLDGQEAVDLLGAVGRGRVVIDLDASGSLGCAIALDDDPLFGPVVSVAVDDRVAEALGDRAYRLAPVSAEAARDMIRSLGAQAEVFRGASASQEETTLRRLAAAVSDVSRLHLQVPGVRTAVLRHVTVAGGDLLVGEARVTVAPEAAVVEPTARRL